MLSFSQKFLIFLIIFATVFNAANLSNLTPAPQKAQAIPTVVECPLCAKWWQQIVDLGKQIAQWTKIDLMATLTDVVAKRILDYIVDQTVVWIAGGGKPRFVTDWKGFLQDAANIAFDSVAKKVGLANICGPLRPYINLALLPVQRFQQSLSCTINQFVSNINNFYADFSQGGWLAYNALWQPQNNFYGQLILINDQLIAETAQEVAAKSGEAQAGGGFLGVKNCVHSNREQGVDSNGEPTVTDVCDKYEIVTPGYAVGSAVADALHADSQWAANIRSWTSALVNAAINRLVSSGLAAMTSNSGNNNRVDFYPQEYQGAANSELDSQRTIINAPLQQIIDEEQYILDRKQRARFAEIATLNNLNAIQSRNCYFDSSEILTAQSELNRLNNEVNALNTTLLDLNTAKRRIAEAPDATVLASLIGEASGVVARYQTEQLMQQIADGSARLAADTEATTKESEAISVQTRLNACVIPVVGRSF